MNILQTLEKDIIPAARLADDGVPSASIAILDASGNITSHVITTTPSTHKPTTLYQACSISKAITGLLVAKLVDQGRLTYETKVHPYIPASIISTIESHPSLHPSPTSNFTTHLTLAHLLSHHSGLSQHGFPGYATPPYPTYAQLFSGTPPTNHPRIRFQSFPGAHFSYSGGSYTLLQIFLESYFNQPFTALMTETVLKPLGLTRSCYDLPDGKSDYARAHWSTGTDSARNETGYWMFVERAAAGLWTTPTDLLIVIRAVQDSLAGVEGAFLGRETAGRMLEVVKEGDAMGGMGLGWATAHGGEWFGHAGDNWPGYCTYVCGSFGREERVSGGRERVGVCVMTNSTYGTVALEKVVLAVLAEMGVVNVEGLPSGFSKIESVVPYPGRREVDGDLDWSEWTGDWGKGWAISLDESGLPRIAYGQTSLKMLPAAVPRPHRSDHGEYAFVVDGLTTSVRLVKRREGMTVEITQEEFRDDTLVLQRII